jgi:hypothetical protein
LQSKSVPVPYRYYSGIAMCTGIGTGNRTGGSIDQQIRVRLQHSTVPVPLLTCTAKYELVKVAVLVHCDAVPISCALLHGYDGK